jgi:hypothetical protein
MTTIKVGNKMFSSSDQVNLVNNNNDESKYSPFEYSFNIEKSFQIINIHFSDLDSHFVTLRINLSDNNVTFNLTRFPNVANGPARIMLHLFVTKHPAEVQFIIQDYKLNRPTLSMTGCSDLIKRFVEALDLWVALVVKASIAAPDIYDNGAQALFTKQNFESVLEKILSNKKNEPEFVFEMILKALNREKIYHSYNLAQAEYAKEFGDNDASNAPSLAVNGIPYKNYG